MKHNIKKTKKMIIWAVIITALVVITGGYILQNNSIDYKQKEAVGEISPLIIKPLTLEEKVEALKDEVRDKIMNIESAGIVTEHGEMFFTFDPQEKILAQCREIGGQMNLDCLSFGPLQFKVSTIIHFEKELNNNDVTEEEAIAIAHDIERASKLFDDVVYGVEGGIWNWSVAYRDADYYDTVIPIIRKLID